MTTSTPRSRILARGDRLGDYEILGLLGEGGMAAVYLARRAGIEGFEKLVAIKRIHPHYAGEQDFVDMFLDEASLAANLSHPNVAQVYDIGRADGSYFFAMEYLHGRDVLTVLKTAAQRGRGLPMSNALTIVSQAAAGLHHAHRQTGADGKALGIVHRDVSPANIVVTYEGAVKIVDFGIAKAMSRRTRTRTGRVKGKTAYLSPEQCRGEELDARSDVFSLGVVLFELTTGTRLFGKLDEIAIIQRLLYEPIPLPSSRRSNYPEELEAIVMQAMARDPADRFASARAVQRAIESFANAHQIPLSSLGLAEYMRELFGESPQVESVVRAAATRVTTTAERAAREGDDGEAPIDDAAMSIEGTSALPVDASADAEALSQLRPSRPASSWWLLASAALLLAVGGAIAFAVAPPQGGASGGDESEGDQSSPAAPAGGDTAMSTAAAQATGATPEPPDAVETAASSASATTSAMARRPPATRVPAPQAPTAHAPTAHAPTAHAPPPSAKPAPPPVDDDKLLLE